MSVFISSFPDIYKNTFIFIPSVKEQLYLLLNFFILFKAYHSDPKIYFLHLTKDNDFYHFKRIFVPGTMHLMTYLERKHRERKFQSLFVILVFCITKLFSP